MNSKAFEKLLSDCENAYRSRYPLIFIRTEETETIRKIVLSDRLVVRLKKKLTGEDVTEYEYVPYSPDDAFSLRRSAKSREDMSQPCNVLYSERISLERIKEIPHMFIFHIEKSNSEESNVVSSSYVSGVLRNFGVMDFVAQYESDSDENGALRASVCLLYGSAEGIPPALREYCAILNPCLPDLEDMRGLIHEAVSAQNLLNLREEVVNDVAYQLLGFSEPQTERVLSAILSLPNIDGLNAIYHEDSVSRLIGERKQQFLRRENLLTLEVPRENDAEIGGMELFKEWFSAQVPCINGAGRMEREAGVSAPRGVLVCGAPGCGKSLAARSAARQLGKPLLQMDVGDLMGKYLGESEKNMAHALKLAEAMSPCVLWIDELDKGFSAAGGKGGAEDSGAFRRMFGKLLSWMQDSVKPCFIFATANDITGLPKEFFRSGRFDELFAAYMPLHEECAQILRNQMKRVCRRAGRNLFTTECWAMPNLNAITGQFLSAGKKGSAVRFVTGADIEKLVSIAMRNLWAEGFQSEEISTRVWKMSLIDAMNGTRVYGDGSERMDSIAMCYIRLLRGGFRPCGKKNLFREEDYHLSYREDGSLDKAEFRRMPTADADALHPYDRALYEALLGRMNRLAPLLEKSAQEYLVR